MKNRIGIVGGGQLARMMIPPAKQLGFTVTVLDPTPHSPAAQIADHHILASLDDPKGMRDLAKQSDFLTLEWELANPDLLEEIAESGIPVNPGSNALKIIKNKYQQKVFLQKYGIPVAAFKNIRNEIPHQVRDDNGIMDDILAAAEKFGYPLLLKAKVGAYDGRGNYLIKNKSDIAKGWEKLTLGVRSSQSHPERSEGSHLYVEQFVPFEKELAIMVARSTKGKIITFPVVETIHKNNILHMTIAPAQIEKQLMKKAETLAKKVMQHLDGAGVFGIELFLDKKGTILVNEIAPRVHNSGHYSIEACKTSQFEQHIRAITGQPLKKSLMKTPVAVMVNILGQREGKAEIKGLENIEKMKGVFVHIYGKEQTKPERKMGHITVIGTSMDECIKKALKARKLLSI